jgi:hypothetical protein
MPELRYLKIRFNQNLHPSLIAQFRGAVNALAGKDSVLFGIKMLLSYNIHIPETSVNGHKELRTYKWKLDKKTGKYKLSRKVLLPKGDKSDKSA